MNQADDKRKTITNGGSTPEDSLVLKKAPLLERLGRYRIVCELASGGMAQVYLAVAEGLEKLVALKVVHPHLAREEHFVHMFLDEARIASGIRHRNVCTVFDYGEEDGHFFMAMDFLAGRTLREVMRRLRGKRPGMSPADVVAFVCTMIADAADGLHAAHELTDLSGGSLGVVHRDVSPHNIFVAFDGQASVIDFGIAHAQGRLQNTATGVLKGKFSYMAPEQIRERNVDRRVDVWALGVCLWEALTLRRLFARDSQADTLMSVMGDPIKAPSELWPESPKALDAIVLKALQRDVNTRYATTRDLSRDLRALLRTQGSTLSSDEMEQRMLALFPAEAAESEQLVRRARSGSLTGMQPISAELLLAQRRGTNSGTRLRPVMPGDSLGDEPSVIVTPARGSLTPSLLIPYGQQFALPMSTPPAAIYQQDGPLGAAHGRRSSVPAPRKRPVLWVGAIALSGVVAAAAVLWPRHDAPAPSAAPQAAQAPVAQPSASNTPLAVPEKPAAAAHVHAPSQELDAVEPRAAQASAETKARTPARTWGPMPKPRVNSAPVRASSRESDDASSASLESAATPAVHVAPTPTSEPALPSAPAHVAPPEFHEPVVQKPVLAPSPEAAPAARPAAPAYHGSSASFAVKSVRGALGSSTFVRTLSRGAAGVEQCANSKAAHLNAPPPPLDVQVSIDEMGRVSHASASAYPVPGMGACVEGVLSKLRSDQKPDVGTVSADVQVSFRAR